MSQDAILRGDHDAFINTVASQVAAWGKPVIIRMFWEMNSNWMGWSPGVYGNTPQKLVASWKKIVDMFRARGAANAKWAWCPNHKGPGGSPMAAPLTDFYPGDAYVDWIGLDSYNMASAVGNPWIDFEPLLAASYDEVCAITPDKPFMLGEVGCHNASGGWFDGMHESIPRRFPRIKAVAWWNRNLDLQSKINTSVPSLEAWKRMATDPYFSAVL
jgi:endoglucanase